MDKSSRARCFARVPNSIGEHVGFDQLLDAFAEGEALVANTSVHGVELAYEDAGEATFDTVLFRSCQFDGVDFSGCTFRDVRFESCRFTRVSMERAWLNRCDFISCSAPGLNLLSSRLAGVLIADSDFRSRTYPRPRSTSCAQPLPACERPRCKAFGSSAASSSKATWCAWTCSARRSRVSI